MPAWGYLFFCQAKKRNPGRPLLLFLRGKLYTRCTRVGGHAGRHSYEQETRK